jgi:hypothetical protein
LTISVEELVKETKHAKYCENVKVQEKCEKFYFVADSEKI